MSRLSQLIFLFYLASIPPLPAAATTFVFNNSNPSGLNALSIGSVSDADVTITFSAGPGAAIFGTDAQRLGVDSSPNEGVTDPFPNRLNLMGGSEAGRGESLSFSFNRPGILDKLFFDGMKDETLEYFTLLLPTDIEHTIFDFEAEFRLNYQGFDPADLGVPSFSMADDATDDISGLGFSFRPGDVFTLTYGQIDYANLLPGYLPMDSFGRPTGDTPNGARFEGLSVTVVPEPGTVSILLLAAGVCLCGCRRVK